MRVVWDPKAKEARTQVANYIRREFGAKRKVHFLVHTGSVPMCTR